MVGELSPKVHCTRGAWPPLDGGAAAQRSDGQAPWPGLARVIAVTFQVVAALRVGPTAVKGSPRTSFAERCRATAALASTETFSAVRVRSVSCVWSIATSVPVTRLVLSASGGSMGPI